MVQRPFGVTPCPPQTSMSHESISSIQLPPKHPPVIATVITRPRTSKTVLCPCSRELRTQKLKSHLMRTQSLKVLPLKPGAGQYIAMHTALPTARDVFLANFYPPCPFQNLSRVFPVLTMTNTGFCVDPQNTIGHPTRRYRQLMPVPVLSAREI